MRRTFEDSYRQATLGERRAGLEFWLAVLWDEFRSLLREHAAEPHGDAIFGSLIGLWVCSLTIVPVLPVVTDWRNLVFPAVALALLLLVAPGRPGFARRLVTVVTFSAAIECMAAAAQWMNDQWRLVPPMMLLACMAFALKTLSGVNARIAGIKDSVWYSEELSYGGLIGLAGVAGLMLGALDTDDRSPAGPFFFLLVVPFVVAVAGFRSTRRHQSVRSGMYVALGSLLVGAVVWFLALPLVVEGLLLTVLRDHPVPAATLLPYWQHPLSGYLFWSALFGAVGAVFGQLTDEQERPSATEPHRDQPPV
ncbi:MAG TPA: hypothetical protein VLK30_06525 [Candidatus Limnocylindrales bacterium]|nr:hypothetical protein [Candidatus Limnocylindrales bacterium]